MSVNKNTNGSIMIAALIVTLLTGSLVGFFLKTVTQEIENSYRARMALQAINMAESGLEFGILAMRARNWSTSGWSGSSSGYYRDSFKHIDFSGSSSGSREIRSARVYFEPNAYPPRAISEGIIQSRSGVRVARQIYIEMGNRSLFANGVLAKDTVKFDGNNIFIDSYNSLEGPYDTTANRLDNGSVASISIESDVLNMGNANIWGRVATGGSEPKVGPNGSILGEDSPAGYSVDPDRVSRDFYAAMPDALMPTLSSPITSLSTTTLGSPASDTNYVLDSLTIGSKESYLVEGNVELIVKDDVDISGVLELAPGATLTIHVGGDFIVSGNSSAIVNPDDSPTRLTVYGTGKDDPTTSNDETPLFKLAGNGAFYGAVYAPNAQISLDGSGNSGEMFGAVVGLRITFGGGFQFHYDEALADFVTEGEKKVTRWVELTDAAQKRNMATILNDGL